MSEHAILSPSASYRWMECTGSIGFSRYLTQRGISMQRYVVEAEQGTIAHDVAASRLKGEVEPKHSLNSEMLLAINTYIAIVQEKAAGDNKNVFIEHKVDFSKYTGVPNESFGTADAVIVDVEAKKLTVIDFKSGLQYVESKDNSQLWLYGLGALDIFELIYCEFEVIELIIVQPRIDNISIHVCTRAELLEYACGLDSVAKEAMNQIGLSDVSKFKLSQGEHCSYCICAPFCHKATAESLGSLVLVSEDVKKLTDSYTSDYTPSPTVLSSALKILPQVRAWVSNVEMVAQAYLDKNKSIPDFEVSHGRSGARRWKDPETIVNVFEELGVTDYVLETVMSPPQLEKTVTPEVWEALEKHIEQPKGKKIWRPSKVAEFLEEIKFTKIEEE